MKKEGFKVNDPIMIYNVYYHQAQKNLLFK
jgi:hypothetical protein